MSVALFVALVLVVSLERLAELVVSKRNAAWAFARTTSVGDMLASSEAARVAPSATPLAAARSNQE